MNPIGAGWRNLRRQIECTSLSRPLPWTDRLMIMALVLGTVAGGVALPVYAVVWILPADQWLAGNLLLLSAAGWLVMAVLYRLGRGEAD